MMLLVYVYILVCGYVEMMLNGWCILSLLSVDSLGFVMHITLLLYSLCVL